MKQLFSILLIMTLLFCGSLQAEELVAHWKFDEGSGTTAIDSSGNNHNGTISGATWTTGINSKALNFDGTNDYIEVPDSDLLEWDFESKTYSFWTKISSSNEDQRILNKGIVGNSWIIDVYSGDGKVRIQLYKDGFIFSLKSNTAITDNNWHQVAFSYDKTTSIMKLYVDGQYETEGAVPTGYSGINTTGKLIIGKNFDASNSYLKGILDDVRIYDYALSATDIQNIYAQTPNKLIAHYKFDEGSGTTAIDSSGNNYNGTIFNPNFGNGISGTAFNPTGLAHSAPNVTYMDFNDAHIISGLNQFSISVWFKAEGSFSEPCVLANNSDTYKQFLLGPDSTNKIFFGVTINGAWQQIYSNTTIQINQWYHVVVNYDGNAIKMFVNGTLQSDTSSVAGTVSTSNIWKGIKVGREFTNPNYVNFDGLIDDVRIYGYALSAVEVSKLYYDMVSPEMVSISAGTFNMGSPESDTDAFDNEKPQHQVSVSAFEIGKYEVTNFQFCQFLNDNNSSYYDSNMKITLSGSVYVPNSDYEKHPVEYIDYADAVAYCNWLSNKTGSTYRLPTEAEWEYVCRSGSATKYHWGDTPNTAKANYWDTDVLAPTQVGSYPANSFGVYDMNGNLFEWCSDYYNSGYYSTSPSSNPHGASNGTEHILRGGSWGTDPQYIRSASRFTRTTPSTLNLNIIGFRVVKGVLPDEGNVSDPVPTPTPQPTPEPSNYTITITTDSGMTTIPLGGPLQLYATTEGLTETYTWTSFDENCATVDENGLVCGNGQGSTFIYATGNISGATASIEITVWGSSTTTPSFPFPSFTFDTNVYYDEQVQIIGGNGPYVFEITFGELPAGLELTSDGHIFGTPTEAGIFIVTIQVTDSSWRVAEETFLITVYENGVVPPPSEPEPYPEPTPDDNINPTPQPTPYEPPTDDMYYANSGLIVRATQNNQAVHSVNLGETFNVEVMVTNLDSSSNGIQAGQLADPYISIYSENNDWEMFLTYDFFGNIMFTNEPHPLICRWNVFSFDWYTLVEIDLPADATEYNGSYLLNGYLAYAGQGLYNVRANSWPLTVGNYAEPDPNIPTDPNEPPYEPVDPVNIEIPDGNITFNPGDNLVLDMVFEGVSDFNEYDVYCAIVYPGDWMQFVTINSDGSFGNPDEAEPIVQRWVPGRGNFRILDKPIPPGWEKGDYDCYLILVPTGENPLDTSTWVYSSVIEFTVQ